MRICFASDLHGSQSHYDHFEELLRKERPDLAILGGDMFPDGDLDDPSGTQGRYVQETFIPRLDRWREQLPGMAVACILGNHDWLCTEHALHTYHEQGVLTMLDVRRPWSFRGVHFLGYSCTPPTPYWVKDFERLDSGDDPLPETGGAVWDTRHLSVRQVSPSEHFGLRPSMAADLEAVQPPPGKWIFVCHAPPYESQLDRLPHIEYAIGSKAVRSFVRQKRPLLALHGHIHEAPMVTGSYQALVDGVLCVNPGQSNAQLHAVTLDSDRPAETLRHTVFR